MNAVILVGGKATRLLPLTCNTPKAMVPVLNIPFLEYAIRHLSRHNIEEIVLAQGHLSQPIENYLGDGTQFGVKLHYSIEETPLGTAGAIKNAEKYLNGTCVALNGDVFTDLDVTAMIRFHREKKAVATIALTPVDDPTAYGVIETTPEGRVTRFLEKPAWSEVTSNMINAGTYLLEPDVLARIPSGRAVSIEREVFPQLLAEGKPVYGYPSSAYWLDIGTPEKYLQLNRDLLTGRCPQFVLDNYAAVGSGSRDDHSVKIKVAIGMKSSVHHTAEIKQPVVIGDNCTIGPGVRLIGPLVIGSGAVIGESSVIEQSVVWRNLVTESQVTVKNSVLADNCRLNEGSSCDSAVLGDNVTLAAGAKVLPSSRIEPGSVVAKE